MFKSIESLRSALPYFWGWGVGWGGGEDPTTLFEL